MMKKKKNFESEDQDEDEQLEFVPKLLHVYLPVPY